MALHLPLYELLSRMSFQEYCLWLEFFSERPIGWREDDRAVKQMFATGNMKNITAESIFSSLATMAAKRKETLSAHNGPIISKGSPLFQGMMNAKGGEKLSFLGDA